MPLETMIWRNCLCDDVMSGAKLWVSNLSDAAIPVNYTSAFF